jgi:hypothetical protein
VLPRPSWHSRVISAFREVGTEHGFKLVTPSVVYFELSQDRVLRYLPDVLLLRKRKGIRMILCEVETGPPAKIVAGDIALAAMVTKSNAKLYPYDDFGLGTELRRKIVYRKTYDARTPGLEIPAGSLRISGSRIGTLDFLLVVRDRYDAKYYGRYLEVAMRKEWGQNRPFRRFRCVTCDVATKESARRSAGKVLSFFS